MITRIRLASNTLVGEDAALGIPRELGLDRAGLVVNEAVADQSATRHALEEWGSRRACARTGLRRALRA